MKCAYCKRSIWPFDSHNGEMHFVCSRLYMDYKKMSSEVMKARAQAARITLLEVEHERDVSRIKTFQDATEYAYTHLKELQAWKKRWMQDHSASLQVVRTNERERIARILQEEHGMVHIASLVRSFVTPQIQDL